MRPLDRLLQNRREAEVLRGRIVDTDGKVLKVFLYARRRTIDATLPPVFEKFYIPETTLTVTVGDSTGTATFPKTYLQIDLEELVGLEALVVRKGGRYYLLSVG